MSKTVRQNPPPCKDRTIRTRLQRLNEEENEDKDTIRYALTNGATATIEREDDDVNEQRIR